MSMTPWPISIRFGNPLVFESKSPVHNVTTLHIAGALKFKLDSEPNGSASLESVPAYPTQQERQTHTLTTGLTLAEERNLAHEIPVNDFFDLKVVRPKQSKPVSPSHPDVTKDTLMDSVANLILPSQQRLNNWGVENKVVKMTIDGIERRFQPQSLRVLVLAAQGLENQEIARLLDIKTPARVSEIKGTLQDQLKRHTIHQVYQRAIELKIIPPRSEVASNTFSKNA
jgi:DNA-binding CsgD family transcriptional regulator